LRSRGGSARHHPGVKLDEGQLEIGSIGIQHGAAWCWGIDAAIPMRVLETQGRVKNRTQAARDGGQP
jgi:hypothetical protein